MHPADDGTAHHPVRSPLCPVDLVPGLPPELTRVPTVPTTTVALRSWHGARVSPRARASCPTRPTCVTTRSRVPAAAS